MAIQREIIEGNLGRISELRELNGGNAVLNISLAVTPRKRVGDKWEDDETVWTECTLWGNLARSFAESNLKAGTQLIVIGTRKAQKRNAYTNSEGREIPERIEQVINVESIGAAITAYRKVLGVETVQRGNGATGGNYSQPAQNSYQQTAPTQSRPAAQSTPAPAATNTDSIFGGTDSSDIFGGDDSGDIFGDF